MYILTCITRLRLSAACAATLAFSSCAVQALSADDARHLLSRTGFGAAPHEIRALLPLTREQAVDRLLTGLDQAPTLAPPPAFLAEPTNEYLPRLGRDYLPAAMAVGLPMLNLGSAEETALTHRGMQEMEQLRVWWLDTMISSPSPMAERLALFWQGHFTSKYFDVLGPRLMYDQLQQIRAHGTRNYADLLHAMVRDPAMLVFLDNAVNTRHTPNENLARELLELFTLGTGHYSEFDVKALARTLSGHSVDFGGDWRYLVREGELDTTAKHFLGRDDVRTLEDAERVILEQPQAAVFVADKFYREFVSPDADPREVARLAAVLRTGGYELRPFLREMLLSPAFWASENRGRLVKSPVELLVGLVRTFGIAMPDVGMLAEDSRLLGEDLFEPPSVAGWKRGMAWLNPQSLGMRSERVTAIWSCRDAGREALRAGADDLLVRFSAERAGPVPVRLGVRVDGVPVAAAQARCPAESIGAGQAAGKPGWDLLRIPRKGLPAKPHTIDVVFERGAGEQANLFINWVQLDGKRIPVYLSDIRFDAGQPCSAQVPKGMMYCPGVAHFDIAAIEAAQHGMEPTLLDRRYEHVNSIIEFATTRLPLVLRPAARPSGELARDIAEQWQGLPLPQAVLPVAPLLAAPAGAVEPDARLESLLLDPAFNLK